MSDASKAAAFALLIDPRWKTIADAMDRFIKGEANEFVTLDLIGKRIIGLDAERQKVLIKAGLA